MAAKLGAILTRCALGPVQYAGGCIMASKVPDGLRELGPEGLWGGLERGIAEVAEKVGVAPRDVQGLLPMADLQGAMTALGGAQRAAVAAWQLYAGHLGGLMAGIADLTVDGRAPDAGLCLDRLATKLSRDKPLAVPLLALADAVRTWEDMVEAACAALDDAGTGGRLAAAYRRRVLVRNARLGALVIVPIVAIGLAVRVAVVRSRVGAALEATDPCAAIAIASGDVDHASGAQQATIVDRVRRCEEGRVVEARRVEADRDRAAVVEKQRLAKADREARCAALADHLAAGTLAEADAAVAGEGAPLLSRVARRALVDGDLGPADPALPCLDTKAADGLRAAFAGAVVAAPWMKAGELSPVARAAVIARAGAIPRWTKGVSAVKATAAAKKAIVSGDPGDLARAKAACEFVAALGWPAGPQCDRASTLGKRRD